MVFSDSDYAALFAKLIARTAKDIDVLIESLPSEESSLELQVIWSEGFAFVYFIVVQCDLTIVQGWQPHFCYFSLIYM